MKKVFALAVLTVAMFVMPSPKAEARSFVSVLALTPDMIFHVVTVGTDTGEYAVGKAFWGVSKVDYYADEAVVYFHDLAHPNAVAKAAKAARKAAKKAAKLANQSK